MPGTPWPEASRTNCAMLRSRRDQDIQRLAQEDADNPATTEKYWADADVVDWFKSRGRGHLTWMNAIFRRHMEAHRKTG